MSLWLLFAALPACAPSDPNSAESSMPTRSQATGTLVTEDPAGIEVQSLDRAGYQRFIKAHLGHVVLVDFWATWCPPCIEEFPHTVLLSQKYGKQGLVVATLALEDLEGRASVNAFLRDQKAAIPNFISAYGGTDGRAMDEFELQSGTIPTLKLYDRQGRLKETFGDGLPFTIEQIEVAIRKLLSSDKPNDRQTDVAGDK